MLASQPVVAMLRPPPWQGIKLSAFILPYHFIILRHFYFYLLCLEVKSLFCFSAERLFGMKGLLLDSTVALLFFPPRRIFSRYIFSLCSRPSNICKQNRWLISIISVFNRLNFFFISLTCDGTTYQILIWSTKLWTNPPTMLEG